MMLPLPPPPPVEAPGSAWMSERTIRALRRKYQRKFNLSPKQMTRLRVATIEQLEACKNDAARRLLLGMGNYRAKGE